jgi:acyl-CoA hydrolase
MSDYETFPDQGVDPISTRTEMTWIVMPGQANALGTVFGGQIMAWIDVCAAVSAQRFARQEVVTVGMDRMSFKAPIRQGEIVIIQAMVNWAGRSSMEVGVRVEKEVPTTGQRIHTSTAYLTFVSVSSDGQRCSTPPLSPKTEVQHRRWHEAVNRRRERLAARGGAA